MTATLDDAQFERELADFEKSFEIHLAEFRKASLALGRYDLVCEGDMIAHELRNVAKSLRSPEAAA